jgi:hypothetical protein
MVSAFTSNPTAVISANELAPRYQTLRFHGGRWFREEPTHDTLQPCSALPCIPRDLPSDDDRHSVLSTDPSASGVRRRALTKRNSRTRGHRRCRRTGYPCLKDTRSMDCRERRPASSSATTASSAFASMRPPGISMPSMVTCSSLPRLLNALLGSSPGGGLRLIPREIPEGCAEHREPPGGEAGELARARSRQPRQGPVAGRSSSSTRHPVPRRRRRPAALPA